MNRQYLLLIGALFCCFITIAVTSEAVERKDFVGVWSGQGTYTAADETNTGPIFMELQLAGSGLAGNVTVDKNTGSISGTVANGVFTFPVPNSDPGDPECTRFDVTARATLDETLAAMEVKATGTFCGPGGGESGVYTANLHKQGNLQGVQLLLLKKK